MVYDDIAFGTFVCRPNRFIANVILDGREAVCHVKNTGRCGELLVPGARVVLCRSKNPARRTAFDLVSVYKGELLVNIDSAAPNKAAAEYIPSLFGGVDVIRPEVSFGDSRFDFYWEKAGRRGFVEVKGVTLESDGVCRFPDAPTLRGTKHLNSLIRAVREGYEAMALFIVQMSGMKRVEPNTSTDPAFAAALENACNAGVRIAAAECDVTPESMTAVRPLPIYINGICVDK